MLVIALIASIVGVIGESLAGSTLMHLASVALVVAGLITVVVVVPGLAADHINDTADGHTEPPVARRPPRV